MRGSRQISIVLVQLGTKIPDYVFQNILRIRKIFPKLKIVLIHDLPNEAILPHTDKYLPFRYIREKSNLFEKHITTFDPKFRNGYWQYTVERFFALAQYHSTYQNQAILHIESDILLFSNFPVEKINELELISWMPMDKSRDIGAIVFLPNSQKTSWLVGTRIYD
jgi:hypothetical protein